MTQINADIHKSDASHVHQKSLKRTGLAFCIIFCLSIALGYLLFQVPADPDYRGFWVLLSTTWIAYWIVAFRSRALDFKHGWRFVGSVVLSIAAAFATVIAFVAIVVILSGRGT